MDGFAVITEYLEMDSYCMKQKICYGKKQTKVTTTAIEI